MANPNKNNDNLIKNDNCIKNDKNLKIIKLNYLDVPNIFEDIAKLENENYSDCAYPKNDIINMAKNLNYIIFVMQLNEITIGYIIINYVLDEGSIFKLTIKKQYRGNHYSKVLLNYAIEKLKDLGIDKIFIDVKTNNTVALNLYQKIGFKVFGKREKYYNNGDDCYILKL